MAWLLVALRRLRDERTTALALAALVFATALVFAIAPRILEQVADEAIRTEIGAAAAVERNIQLLEERRVGPDGRAPMDGVAILGERLEARMPASVNALVADRSMFADTPRFSTDIATLNTAILRFAPGVSERVRLVTGRTPSGTIRAGEVPAFEAMVSSTSAAALGITVGDTLRLEVDTTDRLALGGHDDRLALDIVGVYDLTEPDDDWWLGDPTFSQPFSRQVSPDIVFLDVTYMLAPEAYDAYMRATEPGQLPLRYTWRYHVDTDRLSSSTADSVVADLQRLEGIFTTAATGGDGTAFRSGLLRLATEQRIRWTSAEVILTVAAIGPAAVAVSAIALVAALAARRRRQALALWRGRGASTSQVASAAIAEGGLVAIPSALLGLAVAVTLVPGPPIVSSAILALGVAGTAIATILVTVLAPGAADPTAGRGGDRASVRRGASPRRLVLEGLIVVLAVAGVMLLRERGVRGTGAAGELAGADPFIAAVPVLVGVAAALIAMRLFPLGTRLGAAIAAGRRDLVPVLALRRSARGAGHGGVLLVLLATAAIGAFAATTLVHLDRSADTVSWQAVGATIRIDRESREALRRSLRDVELPGATAEAIGWLGETTFGSRGTTAELLAVDVAALGPVVAGTVADGGLAEALGHDDVASGDGTADEGPIPAIVSRAMAEGRDGVTAGDQFALNVFGPLVTFVVVEVRDAVPGVEPTGLWAVADLTAVDVARGRPLDPTVRFVRAPDEATTAIRDAALASGGAGSRVTLRAEQAATIRGNAAVAAVATGVAVSVMVAAVYAGLALVVAMVLAGADRANEVALLRTLGLSDRQTGSLAVAEQGPTVAAAFVMGALLGLGLFVVLRPGLGLDAVVGSTLDVPLDLDAAILALVIVVLGAAVVGAILLGALAGRSVSPIAVVRRGLDS